MKFKGRFLAAVFLLICSCKTAKQLETEQKKRDEPGAKEHLGGECFYLLYKNRTKEILEKIETCKSATMPNGVNLLMMAIAKENLDLVQALIEAQIDVNAVDQAGLTALGFAANKNSVRSVQLLRRAGAQIEVKNDNLSALMLAARNSSLNLIQVMNPTKEEINAKAGDGWTALYFAIHRQDPDILNYLIDQGACTHVQDADGLTPEAYAKEVDWKQGLKILKRKTKC